MVCDRVPPRNTAFPLVPRTDERTNAPYRNILSQRRDIRTYPSLSSILARDKGRAVDPGSETTITVATAAAAPSFQFRHRCDGGTVRSTAATIDAVPP
mmetsp:Transcript_31505/g.38529  ORF Transcript_31505/g.38529 Transcript_31505/m.38529 type:complete len:98 (-) Transcript_31505:176-469(-)